MSKELKALANLMARVSCGEDNIVKAKYDYATIEKALKVLEIIVEKKVNVPTLKAYMLEKPTDEWALAEYNTWCKETQDCIYYVGRDYLKSIPLTKEEYDLLKEVVL